MSKRSRRGPAPKPAYEKKRNNLTIRLRDALKDTLERQAQYNQRSMSEEVEHRLEQSFRNDQLLTEVMTLRFGPQLSGLLLMLGMAMRDTGTTAGFRSTYTLEGSVDWMSNPYGYDQAVKAANAILEGCKPPGHVQLPPAAERAGIGELANFYDRDLGAGFGRSVLEAVKSHGRTSFLKEEANQIRRLLGAVVEQIGEDNS